MLKDTNNMIEFNSTDIILDKIFKKSFSHFTENEKKIIESDFKTITKNISSSRIENFFLSNINKFASDINIDEKYLNELQYKSSIRAIRTLENLRFASLVGAELKKRQIEHYFLKGIPLIKHIYKNPALRQLSDIDILISKEDLPELILILKSFDFQTEVWDSLNGADYVLYKNPNPKHNFLPSQFDIHTSIFKNPRKDKIFMNYLRDYCNSSHKDNKLSLCSVEILFIHLLFHGTTHSSYNVGPMFIMDMLNVIRCDYLDHGLVEKMVTSLEIEYEYNNLASVLSEYENIPIKIMGAKESSISNQDLKKIFFSQPSNSGIYKPIIINSFFQRMHFVIQHFFNKKNILHHSLEKFTFSKALRHYQMQFKRHIFSLFGSKDSIEISKKRFKLLQKL